LDTCGTDKVVVLICQYHRIVMVNVQASCIGLSICIHKARLGIPNACIVLYRSRIHDVPPDCFSNILRYLRRPSNYALPAQFQGSG
jgi:hypothetical protein